MRSALVAFASVVVFYSSAAGGADTRESAPPIVDQLLAHATALELSATQVDAIEAIRDRRAHTLATLRARLRATETQSTAAAQQDTLALMQEIGRVQVLSGREALEQLSPAQRSHWVALQAAQKR